MDKVFDGVKDQAIQGIALPNLKKYIRHRANTKLGDLGLKLNWEGVADHGFDWVDIIGGGSGHSDFFTRRVSEYQKGIGGLDSDDMFGDDDPE